MPPSRRDELIESAMNVFYRHGFHSTGLDQILKESGISRMTLYNHFKSKDELAVATLRRRDEIFRNNLMRSAETRSEDPIGRILALFDVYAEWFEQDDFQGCMFINASAEFSDPDAPARRVSADHKVEIVRYITRLCHAAGFTEPVELAESLNILLEGAIVNAHVVAKVPNNTSTTANAARRARRIAELLIGCAKD